MTGRTDGRVLSRTCAPAWRRFATARPLPVWNSYGPGPVAVLMWTPVLLLDPLLSRAGHDPQWLAWLWLAAIAAVEAAAVVIAYRRRSWGARAVLTLLAVQTLLTVATTWWYGAHWGVLFTLLGLTYGAVAPPRRAPVAVVALTLVSGLVPWWQDAAWPNVWVTALTTFLCGMSTYGFHRLLSVIAELDATRQQLAREAVDRERLRFSRDLHDLLGHTLSVIVVKSEVIRRLPPGETGAAVQHAKDIEDIGRQALVEVREAVTGYRDTDLRRELDRAVIASEAAGFRLRAELGTRTLPAAADTLFGWVVRETVTNVVRHSGAANCDITLTVDESLARLSVRDDGRGGDPADGGGIRGLRERAEAAGGRLTVSSSKRGFVVNAELPLPQNGAGT
ncbi:MAG: sensor histidine kinase [Stackebrandtia sp.]